VDVWTGNRVAGPVTAEVASPLWHTPLFVRDGGVIFSLPQMQYTGQRPWNKVVADLYVPDQDGENHATLYEDDMLSPAYREGAYAKTPVRLSREGDLVRVDISAREGDFRSAVRKRRWILRLHNLDHAGDAEVAFETDDDREIDEDGYKVELLESTDSRRPMPFGGPGTHPGGSYGSILEISLPPGAVTNTTSIVIDTSS
jgi:hypothetical protein